MKTREQSRDGDVKQQSNCSESAVAHARAVCCRRTFLRRSLGGLLALSAAGPMVSWITDGTASGLSAVHAAVPASDSMLPLPASPHVKSVILLWMNGGPSQLDTFDPKPNHRNGGGVRAVATSVPGLTISSHLPQTASVMDRMTLIRCMSTGEGNHARARALMHTGFSPNPTAAYPGLGAILSKEMDPGIDLPENVSIDAPGQPAGALGMSLDPFIVRSREGNPVDNLEAPRGLGEARLDRRLRLLAAQDARFAERLGRQCPEAEAHLASMRGAVDLMRSRHRAAFDITGEPEAVRAAYGETAFGRGCLMARRLVEVGVPFVEVTLDGWDTHEDNAGRTSNLCGELDPAMASLINDLESRGLLASTLVIWMGEFGRTPAINGREGRDHFAQAWSVVLAGGATRRGVVLGETSGDGTKVLGSNVTTADLFRTILWQAAIDPDTKYEAPNGRPMKYAGKGRLITGAIAA